VTKLLTIGASAVLSTLFSFAGEAAVTETVLHGFQGGADGLSAQGSLIMDSSGAFYGVTQSGGSANAGIVFKLTAPPSGTGTWTEEVLHDFAVDGVDGTFPAAGLIMDASGALYGTTTSGGTIGAGIVFKLTPPTNGATTWTETVLHSFKGGNDGGVPQARLLADASGALYGTTTQGGGTEPFGTVFKLTPPAAGTTSWTEKILHSFSLSGSATVGPGADGIMPQADLIMDSKGALYGTTSQGGAGGVGIAFKLTPSATGATTWTETILYAFQGGTDGSNPAAGLLMDATGALYGTTVSGGDFDQGEVFKLIPPTAGQNAWIKGQAYAFKGGTDGSGPRSDLIMDASGALYGTTEGGIGNSFGTAFKLTAAPSNVIATGLVETILHNFTGSDGNAPAAGLLLKTSSGSIFGTTTGGGTLHNGGTVFKLAD